MGLAHRVEDLDRGFEREREVLSRADLLRTFLDGVVADGRRRDECIGRLDHPFDGGEHLGGALDALDVGVGHVTSVVDERHVRTARVARPRDRPPGLSRRAVGEHAHRVDGLARGSARHDDSFAGEVVFTRGPRRGERDGVDGCEFGLALLDAGWHEPDAPRFDALDGLAHAGMVVHRLVHRRRDHHGNVGPEGGRRGRRHWCVVDGTGDLPDGVRRRGCDQEDVGPAVAPTEFDVFDFPREFRDDRVLGGEFERPRMDDALCALGHHAANAGPAPAEFVGEFDGFHRRDRSRDAERDVHPCKHYALVGWLIG